MAIKQVIEVAIKGTKAVVGGFKSILSSATGLISGFNGLRQSLTSQLAPAFNALVLSNERLNQAIIRTQGNIAQNARLFDEFGREIRGLETQITATRPALRKALEQLERDTRDLVGVTSEQVNESFNIVLENIGRFAGQSKDFTDPLESAQRLTRGLVGALGSLGLPLQQARQEFRALISGDVNNRNAVLAQTLQISRREFEIAKANGELVDFLNQRLEVFITTNRLQADSISGVTSNIQDFAEVVARELGAPLLQPIVDGLKALQELLFANQETLISNLQPVFEALQPVIEQLFRIFNNFAESVIDFFTSPAVRDGLVFLIDGLTDLLDRFATLQEFFSGGGLDLDRLIDPDTFRNANEEAETFGETVNRQFEEVVERIKATNEEFAKFLEQGGEVEDFDFSGLRDQAQSAIINPLQDPIEQLAADFGLDLQQVIDALDAGGVEELARVLRSTGTNFKNAEVQAEQFQDQLELINNAQRQLQVGLSEEQIRNLALGQARPFEELTLRQQAAVKDAQAAAFALINNVVDEINDSTNQIERGPLERIFGRGPQKEIAQANRLAREGAEAISQALGAAEQNVQGITIEGKELQRELSASGQAAALFQNNIEALVDTEGKRVDELGKTIKALQEATRAGIELGSVQPEEAVEGINRVLANSELLLSQQLDLIKERARIIQEESKKNVEALKNEQELFQLLSDSGRVTEAQGRLLAIESRRAIATEELNGLLRERAAILDGESQTLEQLDRDLEAAAQRQADLQAQINEAGGNRERQEELQRLLESDAETIAELENDRITIRQQTLKQLEDLERKQAAERIKIEKATSEAVRQVFNNELEAFERALGERNTLIERQAAIREAATIAQSELLIDAEGEITARRLEQEEQLQQDRFDLAVDSAEELQRLARRAPPIAEADQREILLKINEEINNVLRSGNDLLTTSVQRARAIAQERENLRQIEEDIERVRRDSALSTLTEQLDLQADSLDRIEEQARAIFDLEEARAELADVQRDQRLEEIDLNRQALEAQLEASVARRSGDRQSAEAARQRAEQLAREAGISISRFESENSIRNKIAALERRQRQEQRDADQQALENLQRQFEQERTSQVAQERRAAIQNQIAVSQAEARLAQEQADLAELQAQSDINVETREQITLALEQQKIELETAKIRLEGIREATLAAIDGETALAQARAAADAARAAGVDPAQALAPFRDQLEASLDQGIAAVDAQIDAIDQQIDLSQQQTAEEEKRNQLLEAQIQAKEAAIVATQQELEFLRQQVTEQERLNQLARQALQIRQRAAAISADFSDDQFRQRAEAQARRPLPPATPITPTPVLRAERPVRQIPLGQAPGEIIDLQGTSQLMSQDASMTQAVQAARQQVQANQELTAALDRNTQAAQTAGTNIVNNVNQTQIANRSLLVRTQGV